MIELESCPFCGSSEVYIGSLKLQIPDRLIPFARQEVICSECGVGVCFGYTTKTPDILTDEEINDLNIKTAEMWNRRVDNEKTD